MNGLKQVYYYQSSSIEHTDHNHQWLSDRLIEQFSSSSIIYFYRSEEDSNDLNNFGYGEYLCV